MTTCTSLRERLGVELAGTASTIRSWLLLETPGPWGEDVRNEAFTAALGDERWELLNRLWIEHQLRPLVVRRPGRVGRHPTADRTLLVGSTIGGRRWLERLPAAALPTLDLEALAAGAPGHGEPVDGPLFAVCTNGSVDRCCAVRGRPLVAALDAAHPGRTWEVSHVGGCRFAANLLVLPAGVLHGAVTPDAGLEIAATAGQGEVSLGSLRGRTGSSSYAGSAEVALRRKLDLRGVDDVVVLSELVHDDLLDSEGGPEPAGADVLLRAAGRDWRAVVRTVHLGAGTSVCDGLVTVDTTRVLSLVPV